MEKKWNEMLKVDVKKYLKYRTSKDDNGKKKEIPYLPWAACLKLLYDNGAKSVFFEPLVNADGSSLFKSDKEFTDKYGTTNSCYEVAVKITIDDDVFTMREPLMNGSNPVKDNSLTQQRIGNAQKRAFVKGVAIRTGLGFNLWLDTEDGEEVDYDDLSHHSLKAIRERILEKTTELMKRGYTADEIATECGFKGNDVTNPSDEMKIVLSYFAPISKLEKSLNDLIVNDKR